jgi:hypothetical protein
MVVNLGESALRVVSSALWAGERVLWGGRVRAESAGLITVVLLPPFISTIVPGRRSWIRADEARIVCSVEQDSKYTHQVPTVHREGPYRFFFYSADREEPSHVHVERDVCRAKFWLDPVQLARSGGFGAAELLRVERLVLERRELLLGAWHEYFGISE